MRTFLIRCKDLISMVIRPGIRWSMSSAHPLATLNRIKEIGIRRVLGASVAMIIRLVAREFLIIVAIAFAIAVPVSWILMNKWLQGYAYRVNMEWWVFLITGISIISFALLTVSLRAIKAAITNPVKSLRTE